MPLIYPVAEDTPDDADTTFDDFADDWSETWVVEIDTDHESEDEGEYVRLGPVGAQQAWDLAHEIEDKRPGWVISILPIFAVETDADDLIAQIESDDD
ncbi:hypothetical protein [Nocardioides currus]|uniref:Uncharacterized protein n=1 Tax=Nocardioides currus TaxID=2133958 RepID=A0A2R7YZB5_9ACTN|nr:hypothetical protein [Nocardioides currus]PUA81715.1 hypothetical protein C7S10_06495 [Nocardioides currus]